jgi:hypothetical protein
MQLKLVIALVFVTLAVASPAEVRVAHKNEIDIDSRDASNLIHSPSDNPIIQHMPGLNVAGGRINPAL